MRKPHYAVVALSVINTDLDFLRKAIEAGDPKDELLFRIKEMQHHAQWTLARAEPQAEGKEGGMSRKCPYCDKPTIIMFDSDNDYCQTCHRYFPAGMKKKKRKSEPRPTGEKN